MRNERSHPPNCRGKLHKLELLYIHSPKKLAPFSKFPEKNSKNKKIKNGTKYDKARAGLQPASDH